MNKQVLALVVSVCFAGAALAQTRPATTQADAAGADHHGMPATMAAPISPTANADRVVVTDHEITLPSGVLKYKATAGQLPNIDDTGKTIAGFFFVAYEQVGADTAKRPITFVFNGGPGSSAVWLHVGTAGPRRVNMGDGLVPPGPPTLLADNVDTWLASSDLVFIDPVGTGYSRALDPKDAPGFYGVDGDIRSVGEFIRLYLTRNNRWLSPKFLAGESYGTTRASGLSEYLHDKGIELNGIILISSVLEFSTLDFSPGNDLPYTLYLPSYTASAYYHKKLVPEMQAREMSAAIAEAEKFAREEYPAILSRGGLLTPAERKAAAEKLSRLTSLSVDYILKSDLRINPARFEKMLLNDSAQVVGRFDSRLTAHDIDPAGDSPDLDPSYARYLGPYSAAINELLRHELKYETDVPYDILTGRVQPWNFGPSRGYLNVATRLQGAFAKNPNLKLLVCQGWYDLATPFFAADYTVGRLNLSPSVRANIQQTYYPGGHMMYHVSRQKLNADIRAFIDQAAKR